MVHESLSVVILPVVSWRHINGYGQELQFFICCYKDFVGSPLIFLAFPWCAQIQSHTCKLICRFFRMNPKYTSPTEGPGAAAQRSPGPAGQGGGERPEAFQKPLQGGCRGIAGVIALVFHWLRFKHAHLCRDPSGATLAIL